MSLTLVYSNRPYSKNPPTFFTALNGSAKADLFKIIKVYQGLKSLCKFFVGAAILESTDCTKMAVYERWKEETDFNALGDPVAHPEMIRIRENSDKIQNHHEHTNLELVTGECTNSLPENFTKEQAIHLEVFKTQPNKFDTLLTHCIKLMKDQIQLTDSNGLLGYSIHRSLDGTKLAVVGHWKSVEHASTACVSMSNDHLTQGLCPDKCAKIYKATYIM